MLNSPSLIQFNRVTKTYLLSNGQELHANRDCSFSIAQGKLTAIVGENGAGKSTAVKLISGIERPTSGEITVRDKATDFHSALDGRAFGIGMVHQHFQLAEPFTVLENLLLDGSASGFRPIHRRKVKAELETLMDKYDLKVPLDSPIESLSVGLQQRVEILKLLYRQTEVMIFDEPTAVLTPQEVNRFFEKVLNLKELGKTVILITHKLREVMTFADSVIVMKSGQMVLSKSIKDTNVDELAFAMVGRHVGSGRSAGRDVSSEAPRSVSRQPTNRKLVFGLKNVSTEKKLFATEMGLQGITFSVKSGEILGFAGVDGNGQAELLDAIHAFLYRDLEKSKPHNRNQATSIESVAGRRFTGSHKAKQSQMSIGFVSSDRHREDVLLNHSLMENLMLGDSRLSFFTDFKTLSTKCDALNRRFDVRPNSPTEKMSSLSGGNQQKFVIGRELSSHMHLGENTYPELIVVAQPTRGVDLGAIERIHSELRRAREQGSAILLFSTELDEILSLSDRVCVLLKGQISYQAEALDDSKGNTQFDEEKIGLAMAQFPRHDPHLADMDDSKLKLSNVQDNESGSV